MRKKSLPKSIINNSSLIIIDPLGYLDFIKLMSESRLVITDSGGMQEETTSLGVPCVTLRKNTERPITVTRGTNVHAGVNPLKIKKCIQQVLSERYPTAKKMPLWDGKTSQRIACKLNKLIQGRV